MQRPHKVAEPQRALVLFTRDLRLSDQPALAAAVREFEEIVPVFVLDQRLLARACGTPNRVAFLIESLRDLDRSLRDRGGALVVRRGDVVEQTLKIAHKWNVVAIYMSEDTSPYARRRGSLLAATCQRARIKLRTFPGVTVLEPGELTPAGSDHYRVFTPYWRVWSKRLPSAPLPAPTRIAVPDALRVPALPSPKSLIRGQPSPGRPSGGESAGREQLERWLRRGLTGYESLRDDLAVQETSRLSPYLHFGCLSVRSLLERTSSQAGTESYVRQLCWRDFHHQVLAARPDLPHADYRPKEDRWRKDKRASEAWRAGLTGYPIVDAGMRQLEREGFMHNRARLLVASFLTKTLYIDWRLGAAHFAELLVDADVACNVGNWQWVAGTGNDTRPNRVLNPLRQAHRFDPKGEYVRRYVPELTDIEGGAVHEPWRLGAKARRGLNYPKPIIDLNGAAEELRRRRERSSSAQ